VNKNWKAVATLAALAGGLGGWTQPAAAQTGGILPLRIKAGVLLPEDGGTAFNGEVDLAIPTLGAGRTLITAGYAEGKENGRRLRIIPVTVARIFSPPNPAAGVTGNIYFGLGVGAYFLRASGGGVSEEKTRVGGFGVAGYQFPSTFFVEAKYHVAGKVAGLSPNGVALLLGRRF
jgi:hypothetical protein